ncbi:cobalt/nickel transport system permease protein [Desulfovibrionales bacterium]
MIALSSITLDLRRLDDFAGLNSSIHRLDPRAKCVTTLGCIVAVVSFPKHEVAALVPFLAFPVLLSALAGIPLDYLAKKIFLALTFAVLVGLANLLTDRQALLQLGSLSVSGGLMSFCSILLRCTVTVATVITLVAVTGMTEVCLALERLKVPHIFVVQLLFLYRYLFVLLDEGSRLQQARLLRSSGRSSLSVIVAGRLIGQLLLRSLDRAQRIYLAMRCRGFDGEFRRHAPLHFDKIDTLFLISCLATFALLRGANLPRLLGTFLEIFFL